MSTAPLIGLILMGGRSSRMGKDKARLDYHGAPQYRYLFDILSSLCDEVLLSCNTEQAKLIPELPFIVDATADLGPMGGILSCFQLHTQSALLTIPCDCPWLDREAISLLIQSRNPLKIATTVWNSDRQEIEPLLTVWEQAAFPVLQSCSDLGFNSPYRVLINSDIEICRGLSPGRLQNINTWEAYIQTTKGG